MCARLLLILLLAAPALAQPFSPMDPSGPTLLRQLNSTNVDLTTGLVAYWKFDEASGTTAADANGATNTLTFGGPTGSGIFAGGGHLNNCFTNSTFYGFTNRLLKGLPVYNNTGYSLSFWAKVAVFSGSEWFYAENYSSITPGFYIGPYGTVAASGKVMVKLVSDGGATLINSIQGNTVLNTNVWYHIVWTDGNGVAKLYINKVLDTASFNYTPSGTTLNVSVVGAYFYYNNGSIGYPLQGCLDEFRVYNTVLTTNQIAALYNL